MLRQAMTDPQVALALRSQWSEERSAFPVCRVTVWPCAPPILSTVYVLVTSRAPLYVCARKMCLETALVIPVRTRKETKGTKGKLRKHTKWSSSRGWIHHGGSVA